MILYTALPRRQSVSSLMPLSLTLENGYEKQPMSTTPVCQHFCNLTSEDNINRTCTTYETLTGETVDDGSEGMRGILNVVLLLSIYSCSRCVDPTLNSNIATY